ncbi:NAD(P)/FAD-dependent oxidoreductase [Pseudotamlana carrageenivorans]|uniref:NADH:ubiquinone reductase (non-electrogenic) n=1 Tax=Pseudotamlana carrageenivorans TaxID=2069432 RepID=A0A2I7SIE7_9FLAO|nr:NAD(P)/FAD-dependent oxidoreductase [Tamlana carrageenivorans]AUS05667.1 FAD-dependent oxidoreductase [Tamlana carrageenivorans]
MKKEKTIIIVGGGFAGLQLVDQLKNQSHFKVILVDLNNYNFFPPLLYQVAAGFMEPSAISYPYRKILRNKNVGFRMGELQEVIPEENKIILSNGELHYDILVMSTGAETNFFGNENIAKLSLPMKTISDALALRNLIFTRLERATRITDPNRRKTLLSFVIAGAGPTGVELSGLFSEMRAHILAKDYPELDTSDLGDIYLIDGQDAVLAAMSKKTQEYTYDKLKDYGINIKLNTFVNDFKDDVVYLSDGTEIHSRNLIWAAGISARTFKGFKEASYGRGKRLKTNGHNLVEGYNNIYAIGDGSIVMDDKKYPDGHPQLAQVAIQQALNLGRNLLSNDWKAFSYNDKGSMAIIGTNKAVTDGPNQKFFLKGFIAWWVWIFVHIMSLVNFRNRMRAFYDWMGYYINKDQSFRMIIRPKEKSQK